MRKSQIGIAILVLAVAGLLSSVYVVDEREKALDILYDKPEKSKDKRVGSRITRQEEARPGLRL